MLALVQVPCLSHHVCWSAGPFNYVWGGGALPCQTQTPGRASSPGENLCASSPGKNLCASSPGKNLFCYFVYTFTHAHYLPHIAHTPHNSACVCCVPPPLQMHAIRSYIKIKCRMIIHPWKTSVCLCVVLKKKERKKFRCQRLG